MLKVATLKQIESFQNIEESRLQNFTQNLVYDSKGVGAC